MADNADNAATKRRQPVSDEVLTRLDRWIVSLGNILSLLFLVTALIIIVEIVARYVFNSPTFWVHETTTMLCALLFAYGGIYCLAQERHIRIGLIYSIVSNRARRYLDIFISLLGVIYASTLAFAGWQIAKGALFTPWGEFRLETSGSAWDPPLPAIVKTFLFVVLAIMVIQFVLHLIYHIRRSPDA